MVNTPSKLLPQYWWQEIWAGTLTFGSRLCLALLGADALGSVLAQMQSGFRLYTGTEETSLPPPDCPELLAVPVRQCFAHPSALPWQGSLMGGCACLQVPPS